MVFAVSPALAVRIILSVLALSSRFDGLRALGFSHREVAAFSTRSVESF